MMNRFLMYDVRLAVSKTIDKVNQVPPNRVVNLMGQVTWCNAGSLLTETDDSLNCSSSDYTPDDFERSMRPHSKALYKLAALGSPSSEHESSRWETSSSIGHSEEDDDYSVKDYTIDSASLHRYNPSTNVDASISE